MLLQFLRAAFGIYAALMFVVVVLLCFCPVLVSAPFLPLRRAIGRLTVRAWLWSLGLPLRVRGLEHLPPGPCVVVCNHASYVDGIVLTAALPVRFTFLVQHGAADWPYVGLIIKRMGVRFVNRGQPRAAARATFGLIRSVRRGDSLAIFPEGTFVPEPGLRPFFRGAFFIAAKTGLPVVPAVLRGSRRFFADGQRWPAWSPLEVELFPALAPGADDAAAIAALSRQARSVIGRECGEIPLPHPVDDAGAAPAAETPAEATA